MVGSHYTVWRLGVALSWWFGAWACVRERETGARVSVEKELLHARYIQIHQVHLRSALGEQFETPSEHMASSL